MLIIHPIWQLLAILIAAYVFFLGLQRFRSNHLAQKAVFKWKRHTTLGRVALAALFLGAAGGLFMAWRTWPSVLITGAHGYVGLVIAVLAVVGFATGLYMDRNKKKRTALPLVHGINNLVLFILCLSQVYTGYMVYQTFVAGY